MIRQLHLYRLAGALFMSIFVSSLGHADGRDSRATRQCTASEIAAAREKLALESPTWTEAKWVAVQNLLECCDAQFVLEKTKRAETGDTYKEVWIALNACGIKIRYAFERSIYMVEFHAESQNSSSFDSTH